MTKRIAWGAVEAGIPYPHPYCYCYPPHISSDPKTKELTSMPRRFPTQAWRDLEEITAVAKRGVEAGCMPMAESVNAFQIFRRAFAKWAEGKDRGRVLRALMYEGNESREVKVDLANGEMQIYCEDEVTAKAIEELLKGDGYKEDFKQGY